MVVFHPKPRHRILALCLLLTLIASTVSAQAPSPDANTKKAQALLDQMIQAFGGDRWLNLTSWRTDGTLAGFDYHGRPELSTLPYWDFTRVVADPQSHPQLEERIELGKKRDDIELFLNNHAWETTYKGTTDLPKEISADYFNRRDHSLFTITRIWRADPKTLYLSAGQSMVQRHLADKITLISADNLSVTLELDAATHLLLRLSFTTSNPLYGDKDETAEEYDDYHPVQGIPTALRISRYKNGDQVSETYITHVSYGDAADPLLYSLQRTEQSIKK